MKRFLTVLLFSTTILFTSCATNPSSTTPTVVQQSSIAATATLYTAGVAFKATPQVFDTLYNTGKISKDDYNLKFLPIYNKALASYKLAVSAFVSIKTGVDPNKDPMFLLALNAFLSDKATLDNLEATFQIQSVNP